MHLLEYARYRAKDVGVHECTSDQTADAEARHAEVWWTNIVATELQYGIVYGNRVLLKPLNIVEVFITVVRQLIRLILRWHPLFA